MAALVQRFQKPQFIPGLDAGGLQRAFDQGDADEIISDANRHNLIDRLLVHAVPSCGVTSRHSQTITGADFGNSPARCIKASMRSSTACVASTLGGRVFFTLAVWRGCSGAVRAGATS